MDGTNRNSNPYIPTNYNPISLRLFIIRLESSKSGEALPWQTDEKYSSAMSSGGKIPLFVKLLSQANPMVLLHSGDDDSRDKIVVFASSQSDSRASFSSHIRRHESLNTDEASEDSLHVSDLHISISMSSRESLLSTVPSRPKQRLFPSTRF